jgi:hypothetical protein
MMSGRDSLALDEHPEGTLGFTADPANPAHPVVTIPQWAIAEYLALEPAHRRYETLKAQLKADLEAGAAVEPGPHSLVLEFRERQRLTAEHVIGALGLPPEEVAQLRASAPVEHARYLHVRTVS